MVRKTEVHKDELHERADGELERTGQPLCIYEPYHGRGAWPFLHQETTLYRGLSIVSVNQTSSCVAFEYFVGGTDMSFEI